VVRATRVSDRNRALVLDHANRSARTPGAARLGCPARACPAGRVRSREIPTRAENPRFAVAATLSCDFVTDVVASEAPAFSVVADVAIVKGKTPAGDTTWLSFPDGTARREAVHVIHDLPHLVVESVFGLDEGLWGSRATRRFQELMLVTDAAFEQHALAKAAVNSVLNRWRDGPDTPAGVRTRLREAGPEARRLADRLTDEQIQTSAAAVHRLYREWAALPVGGTLRVTWPLHDSWLRLLCGAP
jgi:hypothetical protein